MKISITKERKVGQVIRPRIKLIVWSPLTRLISWVLIISLLNLTGGCMHYFKVRKGTGPVEENVTTFQDQNKTIVIHFEDQAWILEKPILSENQFEGVATKTYISILKNPVNPDKANRYRKNKNINQLHVLNEVHIHVSELTRLSESNVSIPLSAVQKIEIYEHDKATTVASWTFGTIGVIALGMAVAMVIVALTKTSCPFIYVFDGENYKLAGEIYSGSVLPNLERHDFLKLPAANSNASMYQLQIVNEVKEIQHTNLMELWVFDHDNNTEIGVDKNGNCHSLTNIITPSKVENLKGTDVKELIQNKDSLYYSSMEITGELPLTDGLIIEFPNPKISDVAKLSIRAKNSFMLDYMSGQYYNNFGNWYKKWTKKLQRAPAQLIQEWTFSQNIPLTLLVEKNGIWEKIDYYNIAGPVAFKDDILAIPLDGSESDPLKVKLEFGNFFWEIDYAGIDYSKNIELNYRVVPINTAIDRNGKNVSKKMMVDDRRYYIQPEVGDAAMVDFELPQVNAEKRTIFLHSKGWYEMLRDPKGKPDQEFVKTFNQPGQFNQFVNDYMKSLTIK